MFNLFAGINLTPQDEADIVAFLRLLSEPSSPQDVHGVSQG